jgi:arylsulfatase A-like enzyme
LAATEEKYARHSRLVEEFADIKNEGRRKKNTSNLAKWFGMTDDLDHAIGRVLDEVDTLGIVDETYIVIVSDNGYQHWRADQKQALHGKKWWIWDGGLRVPMFVRGPGIKAGSVHFTNVVHYDFLPTFVELSGGDVSKHKATLDGVSIKSLLMGKKTPSNLADRSLYFHYPHYRTSLPGSAMITKNWKVLHWYEDADIPLLFDLKEDIGELTSVAKENPEIHRKMFDQMMGYLEKVGARIPATNPNHDPKKLDAWYQEDPKRLRERDAKNALRPKR